MKPGDQTAAEKQGTGTHLGGGVKKKKFKEVPSAKREEKKDLRGDTPKAGTCASQTGAKGRKVSTAVNEQPDEGDLLNKKKRMFQA